MRSILNDLQERLTQVQTKRARLEGELASLIKEESSLKTLVDIEVKRWSRQPPIEGLAIEIPRKQQKARTPLSAFVIESLTKAPQNTKQLDTRLKEANLISLVKSPKQSRRAIHFTLVALKNAGQVEKVDGFWKLINGITANVASCTDDLRIASAPPTQPV